MRFALKSGIATATGNIVLLSANLGRDVALSHTLGAGATGDAVFLALSLPVFLVMVITLGFRNSVVPFLEQIKKSYAAQQAALCLAHLVFVIFLGFFALMLLLGLAGIAAAQLFTDTAINLSLVTQVLLMSLPMFLVSTIAMLLEGPLQTAGHFFAPALFKAFMPLGFACGIFWGAENDPVITGLIGGHIGAVLQCLCTAALSAHARWSARVQLKLPGSQISAFYKQYGYLLLSGSIAYLNPLVNQWMAAPLGAGAVSTLSYASRLSTGVATLAVSSIMPAFLTQFSALAANREPAKLREAYRSACMLVFAVSLAGVFATWVLAKPVVYFLYDGEGMEIAQLDAVIDFLKFSILQLVPLAVGTCAAVLLSATANNQIFTVVGVVLVAVNIIANLVFMRVWGLNGMAFSAFVMYCCSLLLMNFYLIRRGVFLASSRG